MPRLIAFLSLHSLRSALLALVLLGLAAVGADGRPRSFDFEVLPQEVVEVQEGESHFRHEGRVTREEAARIAAWRLEMNGDASPMRPDIYAVPGRDGYFIVSEPAPPTSRRIGRRLVLIRRIASGYAQLAHTRAAGDAYYLRPYFYNGNGRTVIVADMGAEYAWGMMVTEIKGDRFREYGIVNVAVPGEEAPDDARPHARLSVFRGRIRVSFRHDVIFDPGGLGQRLVEFRRGREIVYQHNGRKFLIWR